MHDARTTWKSIASNQILICRSSCGSRFKFKNPTVLWHINLWLNENIILNFELLSLRALRTFVKTFLRVQYKSRSVFVCKRMRDRMQSNFSALVIAFVATDYPICHRVSGQLCARTVYFHSMRHIGGILSLRARTHTLTHFQPTCLSICKWYERSTTTMWYVCLSTGNYCVHGTVFPFRISSLSVYMALADQQ